MEGYCLVYITSPSFEESKRIGDTLVSERLAACVNIYPQIHSIYWWEGKKEYDQESVIMAKTTRQNFQRLMDRVKEIHPYQCPCILAFDILDGYPPFLEWILKETS